MPEKPVIGVVGGIGSGKSTVAGCFADLGCAVIDADSIAHTLLDSEGVRGQLVDILGAGILDSNGRIDRSALGQVAFGQPETLKFLTDLLHPMVLEWTEKLLTQYQDDSQRYPAIVLDMPLLLEVGWEKRCDFLVFVDCSEEKKWLRIEKNTHFDVEQLKNREKFQISLDKKRGKAHYRVNNNSDKSDVAEQVAQIFSNITGSK